MKKSEEERLAILEKTPEQPRRERQKRLLKFGLDAPDVVGAVKTYRKTILDMEEALQKSDWIVGGAFSLADASLAPYFQTLFQFEWMQIFKSDCPLVTDWYERCRSRRSYQIAVADDFPGDLLAELRAKGRAVAGKIEAHWRV